MSGRESEAVMLDRCRGVATRGAEGASDQREANVFRLAAMLVRARHPLSSAGLMAASKIAPCCRVLPSPAFFVL